MGKGDYIYAKNDECLFVKPTSFVNNSGSAINQILSFYNQFSKKDIFIIYDDIDIKLENYDSNLEVLTVDIMVLNLL